MELLDGQLEMNGVVRRPVGDEWSYKIATWE